ncbi:MAG TPA: hypothetical protein VJ952_13725, partial [Opitutales bacterium]|nr:hypothetical protein [Opitutales bacterium]
MDKKNTVLGIIFIVAGIGFMFWQSQQLQEQRREQLRQEQTQTADEAAAESQKPEKSASVDRVEEPPEPDADAMLDLLAKEVDETDIVQQESLPRTEEKTVELSNDYVQVDFTSRGGAIRKVHFLKTKRGGRDDYIFNQDGFLPALSLSLAAGEGEMREFNLDYEIEKQTADSITFALNAGDGLLIRRTYKIAANENG